MQADISGKVALVTGASQGIGKAIALKLAENGADVAVNARKSEFALGVVKTIEGMGKRSIFQKADLTSYGEVKGMVENILDKWGKIDILVASGAAGYPEPKFFHETSPALYDDYFRTRLFTRLHCIRAVLDHMKEQQRGKIILISSDAGRVPTPGESIIGAAAAGAVLVTKALAQEFSRWRLHINAVCLTVTSDTPAYERAIKYGPMSKIFQRAAQRAPFWPITTKDVAELVLFLASDDSDRITGQIFSVNGGLSFPG